MTEGHQHDRHIIGDGEDRLNAFFARERAAAPHLLADRSRWEHIRYRAGDEPRQWTRYAVGAAAVVLAGAATWGIVGHDRPPGPAAPTASATAPSNWLTPTVSTSSPDPTRSSEPSTTTTPTPASAAAPTTTPVGVPEVVPSSFRVRSVTTADNRHLFALGSSSCANNQRCAALAASTNNGSSWRLVHTFPATTNPSATLPGRAGPGGQLSDVRFANASVGWAFGRGVLRTSDGGTTWQNYPHSGGDVLDVETDGTDVVLTTSAGCSASVCAGPISVVRAPITATSATEVAGTIGRGSEVMSAAISWHAGHAYIDPIVQPHAGQGVPGPVVLRVDGLHPAGPRTCGTGDHVQLVAPASGSRLFAVCPSSGAAGHTGYAVLASDDAGATWHSVSSDRLSLVNAGAAAFAAADGQSILAVSGGTADLHGSMSLSSNGGYTWRAPAQAPPLPGQGWAWVGAPGGSVFYALSADSSGTYWKSTDDGDTWSRVTVAGP